MISVIIPAYNAEQTIEACLRSLLAQTEPDFELLVVDDGSTDQTAEIVSELCSRDTRIRLIRQTNAGVSAARNHGIDSAEGEQICFVDSDDRISPDYLKALLALYLPGVLPIADVYRSDTDGSVLGPMADCRSLSDGWADDYLSGDLGRGILYSACNKLFSAALIRDQNLRFPDQLRVGEDLVFVYRYLCFCREVRRTAKAVYYYQISEGTAVTTARDFTADYTALLEQLREISARSVPFSDLAQTQWAFDSVVEITANPFVCERSYQSFAEWWDLFSRTELFQTAFREPVRISPKRAVFCHMAKHGHTRSVYLLLKSFQRLKKQKR